MSRRQFAPGRAGRAALFCTVLFAIGLLGAGSSRAQPLHEIMAGSVGRIEEDIFECGRQQTEETPCGLSYRYYCVDQPDEVNSPSLPPRGYAGYRPRRRLYVATPAHTGNFPQASLLGPGRVWHLLWDGIRDGETPGHIGYYAVASQIIERGELGNPNSTSCLPVIGQYACFGLNGPENSNVVHNSPLGDIPNLGGLSPIPVPLVLRNGMDKVTLVWEQAAAQVNRDGAPLPIEGYRLFVYPNPVNPPTEPQLTDGAIPVGEMIPVDTTQTDLDRSAEGLQDVVTFTPALKVVYRGGHETRYFSANGPTTGLAFPDTAATKDMDDAATGTGGVGRAIDIEDIFMEVRQLPGEGEKPADRAMLVATVDLVGEPDGQLLEGTRVRIFIDFNDEGLGQSFDEPGKADTQDITLEAELVSQEGDSVVARFKGLPEIEAHSRLDRRGRLVFAVPVDKVLGAVSNEKLQAADAGGNRRQVLVWAESSRGDDVDRVPNTNDGKAPTVAGEVIRFTF